ncbi:MAG: SocA family protein, partial [Chitinophagales bacterium]|nr:SocA family protein [Chitinophagales bacterium]
LNKVGNTAIYFADHIVDLSKTKLLKLIYILDEFSIKSSGIPFFNLEYRAWKYGPVSEELFIDLSDDLTLLKTYIGINDGNIISASTFNDDEFSENDLNLMNSVTKDLGTKSAKELVYLTHRVNAPWHEEASENQALELLLDGTVAKTDYVLDMRCIIEHDERKMAIYEDLNEFE